MVDDLTEAIKTLVVGDPLDEGTDVSALISHAERDRVLAWVREAEADGARVTTGGELSADGVLRPTLVVEARPDMKICSQEVFGPVVAVTTYEDFDEALRLEREAFLGLMATPDRDALTARKLPPGGQPLITRHLRAWWVLALGVTLALVFVATDHMWRATGVLSATLVIAAVLRVVLPVEQAGGLVVRRARIDVVLLLLLAGVVAGLGFTLDLTVRP